MIDSGTAFVRRAGTLILASMILVWALLYFPYQDPAGESYDLRIDQEKQGIAERKKELDDLKKQLAHAPDDAVLQERIEKLGKEIEPVEQRINDMQAEWTGRSFLGRAGRSLEPVFRPLGWDWRIGMAALASFPAREVVVGTLSIIYKTGELDADDIRTAQNPGETDLGRALREATWEPGSGKEGPVFTVPVALSIMVFFALCCQCASTLSVIRRETNSWRWPALTFAYMTVLAYVGALVVYQVGSWLI
jgi:ferrous iron transport protein B